jgi:hypothetical protein
MTVLPFLRKGDNPVETEERNEEPVTKSVILPAYIWDIVIADAKRCRRSMPKHLEAILIKVYKIESNVELDEQGLEAASKIAQKEKLKKTA